MEDSDRQIKQLEVSLDSLQAQVDEIAKRNKRVEGDKAWETSRFRVAAITVITYGVAVLVMWAINISNPFFNALIPTVGFYLSTLSLSVIKKWWLEKRK